jgi:hypothetical protein
MTFPGVTQRAVAHIREERRKLPLPEREHWLPVVGEEADVKPLGRSMNVRVLRYPVLAWYEREQIPDDLVRHHDGLDIGFDLDPSERQLHRHHVVDYVDGRLAWVDASDAGTKSADRR